jgi:hypothetical protein
LGGAVGFYRYFYRRSIDMGGSGMTSSDILLSSGVKDSGAYTSVSTTQPDFATMDLRQLSFTELCLLAIVLMLFFKWFVVDMFRHKF